jgi:mRNA interferase RelE/StbE
VSHDTSFTQEARAELRSVEVKTARRILAKLTELETDPYGFSTTPLVGEPDVRRLRVGDWRVFYKIYKDQLLILIVRVAHRSVAYDT